VAALNFSRGIFASFAVEVPSHTMGEFLDPLSESTNVRFTPKATQVLRCHEASLCAIS
jgi:hypothetical protein